MLSRPYDCNGRPACVMNIDGVPYQLGDGENLLWDDTYPHEVLNESDSVRSVLLLDVWRAESVHLPQCGNSRGPKGVDRA